MIFTFLPEFLRFMGEWRLVIFALVLILIMLNRPKGIFGKHEFGFMRFGEPESIHQKADNGGIFSGIFRNLRKSRQEMYKGKGGIRMSLLKAENLSIEFGGLKAVTDFNLELKERELLAIIGPNGAGKTTIFNMLTGIYKPTHGTVTLGDTVMNGMRSNKFTEYGIARTFQNIRLFRTVQACWIISLLRWSCKSDTIWRMPS